MVSGLSVSNNLQERKNREVHAMKPLPYNSGFYTCSSPSPALGEEGEEGQGRCNNDKEMPKGSGAEEGKLLGPALPDQRHKPTHRAPLLYSPSPQSPVEIQLPHPTRTTHSALPRPTRSPTTLLCPRLVSFPLHLSNSKSEIKVSEPAADKITRRPCARSKAGVKECQMPAWHIQQGWVSLEGQLCQRGQGESSCSFFGLLQNADEIQKGTSFKFSNHGHDN